MKHAVTEIDARE